MLISIHLVIMALCCCHMAQNDIIASMKPRDKAIDEKICTSTTSAGNFIMAIGKNVRARTGKMGYIKTAYFLNSKKFWNKYLKTIANTHIQLNRPRSEETWHKELLSLGADSVFAVGSLHYELGQGFFLHWIKGWKTKKQFFLIWQISSFSNVR